MRCAWKIIQILYLTLQTLETVKIPVSLIFSTSEVDVFGADERACGLHGGVASTGLMDPSLAIPDKKTEVTMITTDGFQRRFCYTIFVCAYRLFILITCTAFMHTLGN